MEILIFIILLLVVGCGVGVISAALGVGGGVLMVPAFVFAFPDMDMNTAKGSSLMVIVFVAGYNSWRMNRGAMRSPWRVIGAVAAGSLVGGFVGSWITGPLDDATVTWVFVGMLSFAALQTFLLRERIVGEGDVRAHQVTAGAIGLAGGIVGGATGTGGGSILVPFALLAGVVSNARVVALSNSVMVVMATSGTVAHLMGERTSEMDYTFGFVNVAVMPVVVLGAILCAPIGRRINKALSVERRRVVMGILLVVMAARLALRALG